MGDPKACPSVAGHKSSIPGALCITFPDPPRESPLAAVINCLVTVERGLVNLVSFISFLGLINFPVASPIFPASLSPGGIVIVDT